ncbi:MAG: D-2-hydroxyacid dehydrogenase [Deltaproteobacteria bacterium]|jgi:glycerate dehydrogenase|nr:D-2-hydroxyacid dehydrogenase [Deltaproteobacteria bacterium]MCW8892440.1 D-2-hydroxyacid dehydrogenase [Deltaproteobacteria bacterium]MCW9050069.1 D-2-hydroxyacid dehydrogenase [Deltaproteobacteria bacterium]
MKIVLLDGYTLNTGDLDWAPLKNLAQCAIYPRTESTQIIERAADAEIVLTNKTPLSAVTIAALPKLQYIGVLATGVNIVDLEAAQEHNVIVTNVPGYGANSVAQMVFALLLEMTQQVGHHASLVKSGAWTACPDFSLRDRPMLELAGKTLGIVGYGQIGRQVAKIGRAFGLRLLVQTAHPEKYPQEEGLEFLDIDRLFSESDIISLNCPLNDDTMHLVNTARLARVKQGALLINTGRGQLIDEAAVAEALDDGYLGGYATDVLAQEPPGEDNPLFSAPNCIITPHIAWATTEARQRLLDLVVENIAAFQNGTVQNRVV